MNPEIFDRVEAKKEEGIYANVVVMVNEEKVYKVYNIAEQHTIASGIEDVDTALAIRRAYCDGYYDGKLASKK